MKKRTERLKVVATRIILFAVLAALAAGCASGTPLGERMLGGAAVGAGLGAAGGAIGGSPGIGAAVGALAGAGFGALDWALDPATNRYRPVLLPPTPPPPAPGSSEVFLPQPQMADPAARCRRYSYPGDVAACERVVRQQQDQLAYEFERRAQEDVAQYARHRGPVDSAAYCNSTQVPAGRMYDACVKGAEQGNAQGAQLRQSDIEQRERQRGQYSGYFGRSW